jgi:hypothetical protein
VAGRVKVDHFELEAAAAYEQHLLGLEVAVNHAGAVKGLHRLHEVEPQRKPLVFAKVAVGVQKVAQVLAELFEHEAEALLVAPLDRLFGAPELHHEVTRGGLAQELEKVELVRVVVLLVRKLEHYVLAGGSVFSFENVDLGRSHKAHVLEILVPKGAAITAHPKHRTHPTQMKLLHERVFWLGFRQKRDERNRGR